MTKDFLLRLTEEHYGAGAFSVYGRLLEEQRLVRGGPLLPMWHCAAALRRAFGGENVLVLGCTNDSLLAHLLGATPVNPLPPHYHCPNCHHLIFNAHADDGWDLPKLACPECGAPMAADGHNLRSRSLIGESVVSLQVPQEQFAPVCAWLRDYWAQRDCQTDTEPYSDAEGMGLRLTLPEGVQGTFEVRVLYPTDRLDPLPPDVPPLHTAYRRIKGMAAAYCQNGTFRNWLDHMAPHRSRSKFRFILAASFTAPLLRIIKQRIFFVYNWGGSKGGKTAALKAALSAWGDPERLMVNFNATQVGLERTAAFYCDLPLGIDERQLAGNNQGALEKIVYMIASGSGKIRGSKGGGLQTMHQWRTVALATGEEPLSTETSQTGVSTRVLEIYGGPFDNEQDAGLMHQQASMDCGWAGPVFIERLIRLSGAA